MVLSTTKHHGGGRKVSAVCEKCGKEFETFPRKLIRYCSQECHYKARQRRPVPKTALGRFLLQQVNKSGMTRIDLEKAIGISRGQLRNLINGNAPTQKTLAQLEAYFGPGLPATETANVGFVERGRKIQAEYGHLGRTTEARAKGVKARTGQKHSPEWTERIKDGQAESEAFQKMLADLKRRGDGLQNRVMLYLFGRLRWLPKPTKDDIAQWALEAAAKSEVSLDVVHALWKAHLQKKGLISKAGRKKLTERETIVKNLMATWPRKADGDLADGFDRQFALLVRQVEAPKDSSAVTDEDIAVLKVWRIRNGYTGRLVTK